MKKLTLLPLFFSIFFFAGCGDDEEDGTSNTNTETLAELNISDVELGEGIYQASGTYNQRVEGTATMEPVDTFNEDDLFLLMIEGSDQKVLFAELRIDYPENIDETSKVGYPPAGYIFSTNTDTNVLIYNPVGIGYYDEINLNGGYQYESGELEITELTETHIIGKFVLYDVDVINGNVEITGVFKAERVECNLYC